ncbi:MAG: MBL fold metallo-hydrolase [Fervidicoccaceae archaeon]
MSSSLLFIGTGAGGSSGSSRWRASTLAELQDSLLLVDCGVGCHYRLSDRGYLTELDAVFITHMHMDHFLGLPELIFQAHMEGRRKPLKIIGPSGLEESIRVVAPHLFTNISFQLLIDRAENLRTFSLGRNQMRIVDVCHVLPAFGLTIRDDDTMIGFSGDTSEPCQGIDKMRGVEVLVHEATCDDRYEELCRKYGHTTARQAIAAASKIGSNILLLNHIDERFHNVQTTESDILKEGRSQTARIVNDLERIILR